MTKNTKPTIFSGVQPSGTLHIGNYLGAISNWVDLQDKYNSIFCVVDYHAITVKQDPKELNKNILDVVKIYMASGINPEKAVIFQQSDISAHTELMWILNCVANAGELKRMTQFRDKTGISSLQTQEQEDIKNLNKKFKEFANEKIKKPYKNIKPTITQYLSDLNKIKNQNEKEKLLYNFILASMAEGGNIAKNYFKKIYHEIYKLNQKLIEKENNKFNNSTVGIFDYPVLMASDILLYNTDLVPVGEDQKQHVELARTLARRFNSQFGKVFRIPEVEIRKEGARIMGLDDPTKKMSKSANPANYIALTDSPEVATKKIMKAVTDSGSEIKYDQKKKPAISNLLTIYSLLTGEDIKKLESKCECECKGYGDFKKKLAEAVGEFLVSFQKKYNSFGDDEIKEILKNGAEKVKPVADETLRRVKEKLGIKI